MALKDLMDTYKKDNGIVAGKLDRFLMSSEEEKRKKSDRAQNVNAPSVLGGCARSSYYSRLQYEKDDTNTQARSVRIFNNGDGVHSRLQGYLKKMGMLLMDEVPVLNKSLNIQGHTDGLLKLDDLGEVLAVLEIKSIKQENYEKLKTAEEKHIKQGIAYLICLESRRKFLRRNYKSEKAFRDSLKTRAQYFESKYQHLKGGSKYTRAEKISYQVNLNLLADEILFNCKKPINLITFIYENKNTQEIKEYVINFKENLDVVKEVEDFCKYLNDCVANRVVPPREAKNKKEFVCRYCDYKNLCWVV